LAWQGAFNAVTNVGDNANKIFGTISIDRAGQVHVLLPVRRGDDPLTFTTSGTEAPAETQLLMVTSPDRGTSWTAPLNVLPKFHGSNFFPWIAAGSSGRIDAVYYQSASQRPNDPSTVWYVAFSQVAGAVAVAGAGGAHYVQTPKVTTARIDPSPVHTGGICTFGIFCSVVAGNRNLADSISIALDPAGGANAVWTNDQGIAPSSKIDFACQTGGASAFAQMPAISGCFRAG
jgi:hypothetical protein